MNRNQQETILEQLISQLELPETAYEAAKSRYENLGQWIGRKGSSCEPFDVQVFPQGSFRLGTAIKPLDSEEEYDLDLACKLRQGLSTANTTQKDLKHLIGRELESYRKASGIKEPLDEKHRCWRLEYADSLSFHMDIVPCIPGNDVLRNQLLESMSRSGMDRTLATDVAALAVNITDNEHPDYSSLSDNWPLSNPEGYAKWFESRMNAGRSARVGILEKAQVDDLPLHRRKTPLQQSIQILKRHRDQMFKDNRDAKPISVIITTIAGENYAGQTSLHDALAAILNALTAFVASNSDEVLNPVNRAENFADKWPQAQHARLRLKHNFHLWVHQLAADFAHILESDQLTVVSEALTRSFSVNMPATALATSLGMAVAPAVHTIPARDIQEPAGKPWLNEHYRTK